jgi:pimeloyl-ACP methyl ester carboxylesterase
MRIGYFLIALLLSGCASHNLEDRIALADKIAARNNFSRVDIKTTRFDLVSFVGPKRGNGPLHVYIEGDGFAWVTRNQPSKNPTPVDPIALKLAVLDGRNAVYLARPCQYAQTGDCPPRYWASARFASEVIDAMNEAVDNLKRKLGADKLVLIGYSGGGAVAALVAARRTDVVHLATVAGNLDPDAWTRLHSVPRLGSSLNPVNYRRELAAIPQTHFIGESDNIVPIDVYRSYRSALSDTARIDVRVVPKTGHDCCWEKSWPELLKELP